jgi:Integrase zinc binding domain
VLIHYKVIRKKQKIYVGNNEKWREQLIQALYNSSLGGHSGNMRTYQRVKKIFYWPNLRNEVVGLVQQCDTCQLNKGEHTPYPGLLEPISIPEGAWELITMDFISRLPKSEGKDVIMW